MHCGIIRRTTIACSSFLRTVFDLITAHTLICAQTSNSVVFCSHLATLWESNGPFGFLLVMFPLGSSYFVFVFLSL